MSIIYDGIANSHVTVGLAHHQLPTEVNKEGDGAIPPHCDIVVRVHSTYQRYTAGMSWNIRLAKPRTITHLEEQSFDGITLDDLGENESVYAAFPRFDKNPSGSLLNIVILIQNSKGRKREHVELLKPIV